jgi:hypothetical protein
MLTVLGIPAVRRMKREKYYTKNKRIRTQPQVPFMKNERGVLPPNWGILLCIVRSLPHWIN